LKIAYTGRQEKLTPAQQKKLDARFAKLAKLLDLRGGEREARVVFTAERHLRRAEITVNVFGHPMVGLAEGADEFTALYQATERLGKQVLKLRAKQQDTKRGPKPGWEETAPAAAAAPEPERVADKRVFRVEELASRKPMTVEEAVLEIGRNLDYLVYRDAETDQLAVLLRRRDGHFDLVLA
jgi:putative sigma-54 modulation protein